jgi:hypothetical protein
MKLKEFHWDLDEGRVDLAVSQSLLLFLVE